MIRRAGIATLVLIQAVLSFSANASEFEFTRIVDTSTAVPGGSFGNFTSVNLVAVEGNKIAFTGLFQVGQTTYSGLYQSVNGQLQTIADLSVAAPSGGSFQRYFSGNDYINGNLVFGAATESGIGVFRLSNGALSTVFAPGTTLPHDGGTLTTLEAKGVTGDGALAAFAGVNSSGTHSLVASANGDHTFLANDDTIVPGIELGRFHAFSEVHARNGFVLFVGTALDPDSGQQTFEPAGVFKIFPGAGPRPIVTRSTLIPDLEETYFKEFENPRVGADGRYYFTGGFLDEEKEGGGVPDHFMGVFSTDSQGNMQTIADSEMALPGLHNEIEEFNRYSLDGGARVFGVNDMGGVSYLYVQDPDGSFRKVLDSTEMLDGKQLTQLRMTLDPTADGITSFRAVFADGSTGVYSFAVPEPTSSAAILLLAYGSLRRRRAGIYRPFVHI